MREQILAVLEEIESREGVRILLAVEAGSRAWGFPSPDSDYDVRFLYVRPREEYLRLDPRRDVIELPISDRLDVNGWDLQKALRLLHGANPSLFEWFSSPIIYRETEFSRRFREQMGSYFTTRKGLYHYLSMARNNYRSFLQGELVSVKKVLYVLRPILACRWILDRGCPPPMLFRELADAQLPGELRPDLERLLEWKRKVPEQGLIPRMPALHAYLESSLEEIRLEIARLPEEEERSWEELNRIFLSQLE